jgi:quinol monooxygenase YgiN
MYGTIARMKVKKGALEELRKMETGRQADGVMGSLVFQSDGEADELWMVAIFRDKESYFANADSPEQDEEYNRLRALLTADPEWHDGEIVFSEGVF